MSASPPNPGFHPVEAAAAQRQVLLRAIRVAFLVTFVTVTVLGMLSAGPGSDLRQIALAQHWPLALALAVGLGGVVFLVDLFTPVKKIGTLVSVFLGLLAAILATLALGWLIDLLAVLWDIQFPPLVSLTKVLVGIGLAYLCITTVLQTQDDFRLVIPYVEFAKELRGPRPLLLDSSALIDARIVDLAPTGILQAPLVIPRFVVAELQALADSADKMRRARGRRGLEMIGRLQRSGMLDVSIDEMPVPGKAVDQMLVELAKRMPAMIVTADVALNRIAAIQGVRVLNLNDVANAIKPALIPGEQLHLELVKAGEQPGQGVGYLDDGTMVVVEEGLGLVGAHAAVTVISTLQTSAGRLIFAKLAGTPERPAGEDGNATRAADAADRPAPVPESPVAGAAARAGPFPPRPPRRPNPSRNPRR